MGLVKVGPTVVVAAAAAAATAAAVAGGTAAEAVVDGLARHFPELTADARQVIAGNYSYSHAK